MSNSYNNPLLTFSKTLSQNLIEVYLEATILHERKERKKISIELYWTPQELKSELCPVQQRKFQTWVAENT